MTQTDFPEPFEIGVHKRVVQGREHMTVLDQHIWYSFVLRFGWHLICELNDRLSDMAYDKRLITLTEKYLANHMVSDSTDDNNLNHYANRVDYNNHVYSRWIVDDIQLGQFIVDAFKRAVVELHYTWWQRFVIWITRGKHACIPTYRHWRLSVIRVWDSPDNYTDLVVDRMRIYGKGSALSRSEQLYGIPRGEDPGLFERNDYESRQFQFDRFRRKH